MKNNGILLLIIGVLLAGILAVFSAFFGGAANPLANLWGVVTSPVRGVFGSAVNWVEGVYDYAFRYEDLEKENAELKKRIAELESMAAEGELASQENEKLRQLLELREKRSDLHFESAFVTGRSATNWESVITINRGSAHEVEAGDCVIDETGVLVGVVSEVGATWSRVRTVIDPNTELGARVVRTETIAIAEGDFSLMGEGCLKLSYLPENTHLITGDLVMTSGLNGTYPSGIIIGAITQLNTEASGMSRYAVLEPRMNLDEIRQVFVITDFDIVE